MGMRLNKHGKIIIIIRDHFILIFTIIRDYGVVYFARNWLFIDEK